VERAELLRRLEESERERERVAAEKAARESEARARREVSSDAWRSYADERARRESAEAALLAVQRNALWPGWGHIAVDSPRGYVYAIAGAVALGGAVHWRIQTEARRGDYLRARRSDLLSLAHTEARFESARFQANAYGAAFALTWALAMLDAGFLLETASTESGAPAGVWSPPSGVGSGPTALPAPPGLTVAFTVRF
jgi:hypothetical protein